MNNEHEKAFVQAFIVREKQERYLTLLAQPKRRAKLLAELYHSLPVNPSLPQRLTGPHPPREPIESLLKRKGAGATGYVISPDRDLDQREMPLQEVIDTLIGNDGVGIVCCLPGRLAFYKAEWAAYLLEKTP